MGQSRDIGTVNGHQAGPRAWQPSGLGAVHADRSAVTRAGGEVKNVRLRRCSTTLALVVVTIVASFDARSAMATTNIFRPVSGAAFSSFIKSDFVRHSGGMVFSTDPANPQRVAAPVGHAMGGANSFTVYGFNNGGSLRCSVLTQVQVASAITTTVGAFSLTVATNFFQEDSDYIVDCSLPAATNGQTVKIYGVKPNH